MKTTSTSIKLLSFVIGIILCACDEEINYDPTHFTPSIEDNFLALFTNEENVSLTFSPQGETITVFLVSHTPNWTVTGLPSWLTYDISYRPDFAANYELSLTAQENTSTSARSTTITVETTTSGPKYSQTISVTQEGATPSTPTTTTTSFVLATHMEEGDYVIVTDGYMAKPFNYNYSYGYLKVEEVEIDNNTVVTDPINAFTFTAVSGGYTIKDSYGRYHFLTKTYNSFDVSSEMPEEGGVWTVNINSDGTALIVNVDLQKTLQYSTTSGSYGSYTDVTYPLPMIYKKSP